MSDALTPHFNIDTDLLYKLEPTAHELLANHIRVSDKSRWYPYRYVPWTYAQDFEPDYEWSQSESGISVPLTSALEVNLLTEDNLPYYFDDLKTMFGAEGVWGQWAKRWTAEENKHSMVIRDGLIATRLVDPKQLELDRMVQMSGGEVPQLETTLDGIIYVALQELATRVSHRNTKTRLDDEAAQLTDLDRRSALHVVGQGIAKVANDENLHYLFYKGLAQKAFEIEPLQFLLSLRRVLKHFKMPGTGIPQFATKKEQIADVGIFDATIYYEQVVCQVVLKQWKIDQRADLGQSEQNVRKDVMRRIGALQIASALDLKSREKTRSALFFG